MRLLLWILILTTSCDTKRQQTVAYSRDWPNEHDSANPESSDQYYHILRVAKTGSFKNVAILIDSTRLFPQQIIKSATLFKARECQALPCNVISLWDNELALTLYEHKQDNPTWRLKHWPYICEHYVADYNVTVGEMNLYPFMDAEYRRWGGKVKRPINHSFDMPYK